MQTFLISNEPVRGFQKTNDYCKMAKNVITEAVRHVEQEDLGSLRNGPFLSPSGHFVYSNYAVITGSDTPDHHFRKCGETAVSLIAFNVERKVVEQCIGTFKKCFLYNLHIQDFDYFFSELRDSKTTMLAFLLEKDELVRDVLKMSPTDFSKRILSSYCFVTFRNILAISGNWLSIPSEQSGGDFLILVFLIKV